MRGFADADPERMPPDETWWTLYNGMLADWPLLPCDPESRRDALQHMELLHEKLDDCMREIEGARC